MPISAKERNRLKKIKETNEKWIKGEWHAPGTRHKPSRNHNWNSDPDNRKAVDEDVDRQLK